MHFIAKAGEDITGPGGVPGSGVDVLSARLDATDTAPAEVATCVPAQAARVISTLVESRAAGKGGGRRLHALFDCALAAPPLPFAAPRRGVRVA